MLRFLTTLLVIICFSGVSFAQQNSYLDLVNTRDGKKYEGQIIHYEVGDFLTIRLRDGQEITLTAAEVKRIGFVALGKEVLEKPTPTTTTITNGDPVDFSKKFTTHPFIGVNFSTEPVEFRQFFGPRRRINSGYSFALLEAYNFSPYLRVGLGAGYTIYNSARKERVASLFGHARLAMSKKMFVPFAQLDAGYGIPIGSKTIPLLARQGGALIHPSIGCKLSATPNHPEISLDLGYRFLTTVYDFESGRGLETRTNNYQRFMLRLSTTL